METQKNSAEPDPTDTPSSDSNPAATATAPAATAVELTFDALGRAPVLTSFANAAPAQPACAGPAPELKATPIMPAAAAPPKAPHNPSVISIAGLQAAGAAAQDALWRRVRPGGAERPTTRAPGQKAPIIPPPEQRAAALPKPASSSRNGRLAFLAATIALVAGAGAAAGAAGFAGVTHLMTPAARTAPLLAGPAPLHRADLAEETRVLKDGLTQVRGSLRGLSDSVGGVRTNIDTSGKAATAQIAKLNDQVAKLTDAVARIEHSQAEPAAKLAKVIETLEKLERRAATIASTEAAPPPRPVASAAPAPETTGTVRTAEVPPPVAPVRGAPPQQLRAPTVDGWAVRSVFDGVALLDGPDRSIEVEQGDNIRGVGRVQEITRQGNRWVVVTNRGLIVSR